MSNISRSVYQKVCEENKKLLHDIFILVDDKYSFHPERVLVKIKWSDKFKKDKQLAALIKEAASEYIKEHPEFDISNKFPDLTKHKLDKRKGTLK
ncbi:MAG TPA: hypothetical protein PK431_17030 [Chitinophagales bacterium]|nr:hypothetical protein [Chitinophagales bacterium]